MFEPEFAMALTYYLAALAGETITGTQKRADSCMQKYEWKLSKAKRLNAQEGAADDEDNTQYYDMRFIQDGAYIVYPDDWSETSKRGQVVEITTPYAKEDLFELKFVQSADVLTITHMNYQARELARYSHYDWRLNPIAIQPCIAAPTNVKATWTGSTSSNARDYTYLVTAVDKDTLEESKRSATVTAKGHREAYWTTSEYFTITWNAVPNAAEYNIYRSVNGIFGYVGTAEGTSFTDDNIEPDLKEAAPIYQNPFSNNNNPSCATYFQQRKVYANSLYNPQTFWASQLATSNNFNISRPLIASDAITQTLADREVNEIRHLIGLNHLIALTSNTEYRINGSDGVFQANPSPVATVQSNYGASHVQPIISGNMIIFVQSGGSVLRDLGYDYLTDSYNGSELSLFASHLFEGKTVRYMAYAKEPYRIIYLVFSDGSCASLTYNKNQKICGWAREVTDGFFESVATIREGLEDVAYFVIRRYINPTYQGSFELFNSEKNSSGAMVYEYRCGNNNYYSTTPFELGVEVYSDISLKNKIGVINVINEDEKNVTIGGTLKRFIERTKSRIIKKTQQGFFVDCGRSASFSEGHKVISGLTNLAGKDVVALADGGVIENLHVGSDGRVTLPFEVKELTIGLPFEFILETLNIEGENTQGLKKMINNVCVNIANSREEFFIGGSEGLYVPTDRSLESVNDSNALFSSIVSATPFNSPTPDATVIVMQNKPLPLTILSLSATFSIEDISDTQ
ncbi:unnamed protein product [Cylicocyclus nassatus]|uniref:Uncharacterized protein n=1 Tax=Cylicocyclus nassatus TaxID=53992 RepID=A0AA36MIT5_CYLNA|nr:unnamed protein product [Cylicocyclus nassatus]